MEHRHSINSLTVVNNAQLYGLVILRVIVGWHILYEGVAKLINPYWSSAAFLLDSKWVFSGIAKWIVSNPILLTISDYVNVWGLTIIGFCLMLGLFSRYACIGGMVLISLYYLFSPPLLGLEYSRPGEGSYLIVNKNLIEIFALYILFLFPTSHKIGFDRLIQAKLNLKGLS